MAAQQVTSGNTFHRTIADLRHGKTLSVDSATTLKLAKKAQREAAYLNRNHRAIIDRAVDGYLLNPDKARTKVLEHALMHSPFARFDYHSSSTALRAARMAMQADRPVISQPLLAKLIEARKPKPLRFVKDEPVFGLKITDNKLQDIPEAVQRYLGIVDAQKYAEEKLQVGGVVTIQMKDAKTPDFYPQAANNFQTRYVEVPLEEVAQKNPKLLARLKTIPGITELLASDNVQLIGMLKTAPVTMYPIANVLGTQPSKATITVEVPLWGDDSTQTALPGAYLVREDFDPDQYWQYQKFHHYVVNPDETTGLPIAYITERESMTRKIETLTAAIDAASSEMTSIGENLRALSLRGSSKSDEFSQLQKEMNALKKQKNALEAQLVLAQKALASLEM